MRRIPLTEHRTPKIRAAFDRYVDALEHDPHDAPKRFDTYLDLLTVANVPDVGTLETDLKGVNHD